jgi:hypothetical protein
MCPLVQALLALLLFLFVYTFPLCRPASSLHSQKLWRPALTLAQLFVVASFYNTVLKGVCRSQRSAVIHGFCGIAKRRPLRRAGAELIG